MKQGKVDRYKSRQVVYVVDFKENFASVVKYTALRIFLAIISGVFYAGTSVGFGECIYLRPSG